MTETSDSKGSLKSVLRLRKKELEMVEQELAIEVKRHELVKAKAEAEQAELKSETLRYETEAERRREKRLTAQRSVDHEYDYHAPINDTTVGDFTNWLYTRRLVAPGKPVTVNIYSPGGSVFAGFVMMDSIREAQEAGTSVTVKVSGMAASMAGIIAQAAEKRLIGRDSYLMLHEISTGMFGGYKLSELADEKDFCLKLSRQCDKWYADRSGGKWTVEAIEAKVKKYDWWVSSEEALECGFVDGIY